MSSNLAPKVTSYSASYSSESVSIDGVSHSTSRFEDSTGVSRATEARGLGGSAHARAAERDREGQVRTAERLVGIDSADKFEQQWTQAAKTIDPQASLLPLQHAQHAVDAVNTGKRLTGQEATKRIA